MTEFLDAELVKVLKGLGKPLSFVGKRCRVSRFSLQVAKPHELRHVDGQVRSRTKSDLFDSREALGDAQLKFCMQICYSLVLITKGRVRIFVRSVEESNGAEAWRLRNNNYVPDIQNRQCATMQNIMMFAKLWCDHAEGFESGSGA